MRTLRASLVGTVILALLAGLSGAVVAQDEPADPMMAPAVVTGTIGFGPEISPGSETFDAGVSRYEGDVCVLYYEASDPRLDGEVTLATNALEYATPHIGVEATTRVLVNDDGRWVGTDTGLGVTDSITVDGESKSYTRNVEDGEW